jgi:hypothetical protein
MALFIAAAEPLETIPWDESRPGFNVQSITESEEVVRRHFTKPNVYYVGAHTGCSCGFAFGLPDVKDEAEQAEDAAGRRSVADLQRYVAGAVERLGEVEMFSAWEGDFEEDATERVHVTPDWFGGHSFQLPERVRFRVTARPPDRPLQPSSGAGTSS